MDRRANPENRCIKVFEGFIKKVKYTEQTIHGAGYNHKLYQRNKSANKKRLIKTSISKIQKNEVIPIHSHETKSETYFVISGTGIIRINKRKINMKPGSFHVVPNKASHSIINNGNSDLIFLIHHIDEE